MMKTETTDGSTFHSIFLAGNIFFASIDVANVLEYGLRIALGTAVIGASKYIAERLQRRRKKKEAESRLNRIRNRRNKKGTHGIGE